MAGSISRQLKTINQLKKSFYTKVIKGQMSVYKEIKQIKKIMITSQLSGLSSKKTLTQSKSQGLLQSSHLEQKSTKSISANIQKPNQLIQNPQEKTQIFEGKRDQKHSEPSKQIIPGQKKVQERVKQSRNKPDVFIFPDVQAEQKKEGLSVSISTRYQKETPVLTMENYSQKNESAIQSKKGPVPKRPQSFQQQLNKQNMSSKSPNRKVPQSYQQQFKPNILGRSPNRKAPSSKVKKIRLKLTKPRIPKFTGQRKKSIDKDRPRKSPF